MPVLGGNQIWRIRASYVVPLPPDWVRTFSLGGGHQHVKLIYDGAFLILPPGNVDPEAFTRVEGGSR